ncbi:LLM class F420-dependent oxidoreductase [Pseudonocardia thermophila]|uniref:LLM class F420-dependent oxidoreductase n=1 Tax=Pseudonocardia thermophila TaxID=1848 RepID=UPI000A8DF6CB
MATVEHGVVTFLTDYGISAVELARATEERGFGSLFLTEHTHIPAARETPWPGGAELPKRYAHTFDPFVALAAMAAVTERIALGTAVSLVCQHDPIVLAKQVASLDRISGGRFELGVGMGWNREEMANHGVDPRTRARRMREHVLAMQAIWAQEEASFDGEFVKFDRIWSWPKPLRRPPILIGGGGPGVVDRVVEFGDGWIPLRVRRTELDALRERISEMRGKAAEAGRGPVTVTVYGAAATPEALESYAAAGVDRVLFELPDEPADGVLRRLDELAALSNG